MGIGVSQPDTVAAQKVNSAIERDLKKEKIKNRKVVKMLLLGGAQSGKSTVLKQIRITKDNGFGANEIKSLAEIIRGNTVMSICQILSAMSDMLDIQFSNEERVLDAKVVNEFAESRIRGKFDQLPSDIAQAIRRLWKDTQVQEAYKKQRNFDLNDSAAYFLNAVERIGSEQYVPTEQDILRSRAQTTGIVEVHIKIDNASELRIIDVGGQRSERKKWIHCFEGVDAVIFVCALSVYDEMDPEDRETVMDHHILKLRDTFNQVGGHISLRRPNLSNESLKEVTQAAAIGDFWTTVKHTSQRRNPEDVMDLQGEKTELSTSFYRWIFFVGQGLQPKRKDDGIKVGIRGKDTPDLCVKSMQYQMKSE